MQLFGKNLVGGTWSAAGTKTFAAIDPVSGEKFPPFFHETTEQEANAAIVAAEKAFEAFNQTSPEQRANFLDKIADEIMALGDDLIRRANQETALPEARLTGERARTVNQLKMFADLVRDGSWLEASIDLANPDRKPLPKPDLRRMLIPFGPVVVFSASNFPLAFSVAGGDTASALAAGNPVVVKGHRGHPGTSELVAQAIQRAIEKCQMPAGVFSLLQGSGEMGLQLVRHPATKAVGFTGSLTGGRALFDAAAARPEPIPVYAEMGSINPVFVLPGALQKSGGSLAEGLMQSVTLGVGQFCTNPGLVIGLRDAALDAFVQRAEELATKAAAGTMLTPSICQRFHSGVEKAKSIPGVRSSELPKGDGTTARASAVVFSTDAETFLERSELREEIFGPATVVVRCGSAEQLEKIARSMDGQLTATIHGTEEDLAAHKNLVTLLQQKVGRLLFNGFPTGVEVCASMHHGGPYPATTDSRSTSVGTTAIKRFARPICFQGFPQSALPPELRNKNERQIWRLVDGKFSKDDC